MTLWLDVTTKSTVNELPEWCPEDGAFVDITVITALLPQATVTGWSSFSEGEHGLKRMVKKIPVEGRSRMGHTVILLHSIQVWLRHYNPNNDTIVETLVEEMLEEQKEMRKKKVPETSSNNIKHEWQPKLKEKAIGGKPLKVTNKDLFAVWG